MQDISLVQYLIHLGFEDALKNQKIIVRDDGEGELIEFLDETITLPIYLKVGEVVDKTFISSFVASEINLKELKPLKLEELKNKYLEESNKNVTFKGTLFVGGQLSATSISGAIALAQTLNETNVEIVDTEDKPHILTFDEALNLSALIAKSWRDNFFKYKALKVAVNEALTVAEIESITWSNEDVSN